jgi:hypothetical protein
MQPSSAGNPPSSYGSQGGAQAGPWGQPAPQQQNAPTPQYNAQTSGGYHYNIPGYSATGAPQAQPRPSGTTQAWSWPQQPQGQQGQQGGYQYQAPPQQAPPPRQYPQGFVNPNLTPPPWQGGQPQLVGGEAFWNPQVRMEQWQQQQQTSATGAFPGAQPPPPTANTDGYPMPKLQQAPLAGAMPGWSSSKWADPNHQTPKYVVGRILQGIPPRTDQMDIAVARIAAAYPGTRRVGKGDIYIPGVGTTDILQSANAGGKAWRWGSANEAAPSAQGAPGAGGGTDDFSRLIALLMGGQPPIQALQQPAAPAVDPNAAKAAAAQALADQRARTAAAEAAAAQRGQGGFHPSFSYY